MRKKQISRKEFFTKALTGIAGMSLVSNQLTGVFASPPELRSLGKTGIMVTPLCFGAPRTNEESLIKYALDKGINFIDTGHAYGNGKNEQLVGRAIAGRRSSVVIMDKLQLDIKELPSKGNGKKGAEEIRDVLSTKLEESLKALNTDYIDVLLYHNALDEKLLFHSEVMKFFSEMKKSGVIKAHGYSAHNEYMSLHDRNNSEGIYDVIMIPFNHKGLFVKPEYTSTWDRQKQISVLTEAWNKGRGVIAIKSCTGGPYSPSANMEPSFKEAVKWVVQQKYISSVALAMTNFEQVDEHTS
jgi:aryl-alcohol dehydrogenase-like predicted oxidoreductase